ncbi:MAG: energy-coupling factor transporter transmembrane protein EcfT [Clostridia bacterium]|nr:energy-coupling factor transporter transmembrane protein EcfT [Clostridia bacterium]
MRGVLDYVPGNTILHRLDPRTKLLISLMICIAAFISDSEIFLLGLLALNLLFAFIGGVTAQALRMLKGLSKACVFMFILQVLFIQQGEPYFSFIGIHITDYGVRTAYMVILRLLDATLPLSLMLTVTRLTDLSNALVVHWHLPYQYAFTVTTALHFIPVFFNDMQAITEAQIARGVSLDTRNPIKKIKLMIPMSVPLLVSSVKKTEQEAIAVELRGFNLRTRASTYKVPHMHAADAAALLLGAVLIAAAVLLNR